MFPFKEGAEPELSTQAAKDLHVDYLLYRATTFYSCCGDWMNQNRIKNIKRIAEEANGALVMPGETWSLNEYVGQRTIEDGYFRAGAIIGPIVQCCDHPANIGGGVSQFATTLYNAVFFSGMKDIAHTPHTLHFPRYPMGREATLGFPTPDVVFQNTTDAAVLIQAEADDTSVTVRFYGNNGGIEVESGSVRPAQLGRPARVLRRRTRRWTPTPKPNQTSTGKPGFTVTVFRYITYPDGEETTETWVWTYDPFPNVFEVHPCKLDPDHREYMATCPTGVPDLYREQQRQCRVSHRSRRMGRRTAPRMSATAAPAPPTTTTRSSTRVRRPGRSWLPEGEDHLHDLHVDRAAPTGPGSLASGDSGFVVEDEEAGDHGGDRLQTGVVPTARAADHHLIGCHEDVVDGIVGGEDLAGQRRGELVRGLVASVDGQRPPGR